MEFLKGIQYIELQCLSKVQWQSNPTHFYPMAQVVIYKHDCIETMIQVQAIYESLSYPLFQFQISNDLS